MNEQIPDWAAQWPFNTLNTAQQQVVLAEMSATAFDQLHQTMSVLADMDADAVPPASIRTSLMQHPALQPARVWPKWSVAAGLAAAFAAGVAATMLLMPTRPQPQAVVRTETVVQHDTIVQTDTVVQTVIRWRVRERLVTVPAPPMAQQAENQEVKDKIALAGKGASMQDVPVLMQFIGLDLPNTSQLQPTGGQLNLQLIPEKNHRSGGM